jgi:hypothetical protein
MLPAMTGLLADRKLLANRFDLDALVEVRFGLTELQKDLSRCVPLPLPLPPRGR